MNQNFRDMRAATPFDGEGGIGTLKRFARNLLTSVKQTFRDMRATTPFEGGGGTLVF